MKVVADETDVKSPLLDSFHEETHGDMWRDCCSAAKECCIKMLRLNEEQKKDVWKSTKATSKIQFDYLALMVQIISLTLQMFFSVSIF